MKIKNLFILMFVFAGGLMQRVQAQPVSADKLLGFIGIPVSSPEIQTFYTDEGIDRATGLNYDKGIQLFNDGNVVTDIFLFNKSTLNGQNVNTYPGPIPFGITFNETLETLKKKLGASPTPKGEHWVWKVNKIEVEAAFQDEKKTRLLFIAFSAAE
jgi:hypothetical protein